MRKCWKLGKQRKQNTTYSIQHSTTLNQHNFKKSILTWKPKCEAIAFFPHFECGFEGTYIWIYGCLWDWPIFDPGCDHLLTPGVYLDLAAAQGNTIKGCKYLEIWGWLICQGHAEPQALLVEVVFFTTRLNCWYCWKLRGPLGLQRR